MPDDRRGSSAAGRLPILVVVLGLLAACTVSGTPSAVPATPAVPAGTDVPSERNLFGVFLGSDQQGIDQMAAFEQFLGGGTPLRVGHTYLDGSAWTSISQPDGLLAPWARWKAAHPDGLFVLNVPMATPNESGRGQPALDDGQVADLLRQGAAGAFDQYYTSLGQKLVAAGLPDAVLVPGWEMNGITYSHRCAPDPTSWKTFFRRVVAALRSAPGEKFVIDFNPSRGTDAIAWPSCYPGDDVVDVIGMDSYDQEPGNSFADYVSQPDGLQAQVDFAKAHGKPVSYPEWGLFTRGDNPDFIRAMRDWMASHDTFYNTFTDYCPHGVFTCPDNPRSAAAFKQAFGAG